MEHMVEHGREVMKHIADGMNLLRQEGYHPTACYVAPFAYRSLLRACEAMATYAGDGEARELTMFGLDVRPNDHPKYRNIGYFGPDLEFVLPPLEEEALDMTIARFDRLAKVGIYRGVVRPPSSNVSRKG